MKKSIEKKTSLFTHPVFIVGTYDEKNTPNMSMICWGGICCSEPPSIAISVRKSRHTYNNIMSNKAFTVNIPSEKYLKESDYTGIYSGRDENKFETTKLTPVDSKIVKAPYIEEFPLSLICKVTQINELGIHIQFVGEIMDILCDDSILNEDDVPDILKAKPFVYDSTGRNYYGVGEMLSAAYSAKKPIIF